MNAKIVALEVFVLRAPATGGPHWVSHFSVATANEILVRLRTSDGVEGLGLATSYAISAEAWSSRLSPRRRGRADSRHGPAGARKRLHEKMLALTWGRPAHEKGWSREALIRIAAAVDIACWDIVGRLARLPLHRLFGGYRDRVPCYVTCAYYRDGKDLHRIAR